MGQSESTSNSAKVAKVADKFEAMRKFNISEEEHLADPKIIMQRVQKSEAYSNALEGGGEDFAKLESNLDFNHNLGLFMSPGLGQTDVEVCNVTLNTLKQAMANKEQIAEGSAAKRSEAVQEEARKLFSESAHAETLVISCTGATVMQRSLYIKGQEADSINDLMWGLIYVLAPVGWICSVASAIQITAKLVSQMQGCASDELRMSTDDFQAGFGIKTAGDSALAIRMTNYSVFTCGDTKETKGWIWNKQTKEATFRLEAQHYTFLITKNISSEAAANHLTLTKAKVAENQQLLQRHEEFVTSKIQAFQAATDRYEIMEGALKNKFKRAMESAADDDDRARAKKAKHESMDALEKQRPRFPSIQPPDLD